MELFKIIEETKGEYDSLITVVEQSACPEFDELKIGILKLQRGDVKKSHTKRSYDEKYKALQKEIDNALKQASSKEKEIIDELRKDLQAEHNRFSELLKELEEKQEIIDSKSVQLCILELKQNNVQNALNSYRNVSDTNRIKDINHSSYENVESFQSIGKW